MARRRGRRRYKTEDDESDESFIVSGEETILINGQEIVVEDAVHVVKNGQEYVIIDNQFYPVDRPGDDASADAEDEIYTPQYDKPAAPSSGFGIIGIIIIFAIVGGVLTYLFVGPVIGNFLSGSGDSDNVNVISPNRESPADPTPEVTQIQSKESQIAEKIKNAMDYTNPITRDYAVSIIPNAHEGNYNIAQICDLWDAVYKKWIYVNDPRGSEYFSPASRTIQLGLKGDCDDFAIAVGSMIQSIGGSTRIVTAYNQQGGHAYPEVYIGTSKTNLDKVGSYISKRYRVKGIAYHTRTKDGITQYWLNLDWQSKNPGGKFFHDSGELTIYYPNGYWYKTS